MTSPVKIIREKLLLTQTELGLQLGVSREMIWAYEKGKSMPRFSIIKKIIALARENDIEINAEDFFKE